MTAPGKANEPSEFSWGPGMQPNPEYGGVPKPWEVHRALLATGKGDRTLDPGYVANYDDYVDEGAPNPGLPASG